MIAFESFKKKCRFNSICCSKYNSQAMHDITKTWRNITSHGVWPTTTYISTHTHCHTHTHTHTQSHTHTHKTQVTNETSPQLSADGKYEGQPNFLFAKTTLTAKGLFTDRAWLVLLRYWRNSWGRIWRDVMLSNKKYTDSQHVQTSCYGWQW